jgi:hypothetical protein
MGTKAGLNPPYPVVASFPTHAEAAALLSESSWTKATDLVLLDPSEPDGYARHWSAPGFPPMRHIAYAVQWFSLAFALAVIYLVTNLHRRNNDSRGAGGGSGSSSSGGGGGRSDGRDTGFYLYYGHADWHPGGRVNSGELVTPPRPLPSLALPRLSSGDTNPNFLKGKWTFLYVASGPCTDACLKRLYDTRQVRIALDRDMNRVQRVLIADVDCCDAKFLQDQHPDLITVRADAAAAPLLAMLPGREASTRLEPGAVSGEAGRAGVNADTRMGASGASGASGGSRVYLIDPLGNLMMSYAPSAKSKGMLEDMKRLLRLSSIG